MFEQWSEVVGGDAGFEQNGFLRISNSLSAEELGADLELVRDLGVSVEVLDSDELSRLCPYGEFDGAEVGLLVPAGGFADPIATTRSLGEGASRHGVEIIEGAQVTSIEVTGNHIQEVRTSTGDISTPLVVNCAGVWAGRIAAMVGVELPIENHRTPTSLFRRPQSIKPDAPILSDGVHHVYLRSMGDQLLRAAHFGWAPDLADPDNYDETIRQDQFVALRDATRQRYEGMRRTVFAGGFSALYDMTPDGHPIVGPVGEVEGFWCNCGWSGNGFASAPVLGKCLAQSILGEASDVDISLFRWPRDTAVTKRPDLKWVYR